MAPPPARVKTSTPIRSQVDAPAHEPPDVPLERVQSRPLIPTTPRIRRRVLHRPRHDRSLRPAHHGARNRRLRRHRRHHRSRAQREREHRLGRGVSLAILPSSRPPSSRVRVRTIINRRRGRTLRLPAAEFRHQIVRGVVPARRRRRHFSCRMLTCLERQRSFATSSSSSSSAERRVGGANDDARCGDDDGRYHSHLALSSRASSSSACDDDHPSIIHPGAPFRGPSCRPTRSGTMEGKGSLFLSRDSSIDRCM